MTEYRYDRAGLVRDYARAAAGLVLTAGPLAVADAGLPASVVLAGLAALFLVFGARTAVRHASHIRVDEAGLATTGPFARRIPWDGLVSVVLTHYTTRRGRAGWMQLKVSGAGTTIRIESTLTGFADLVDHVAREAATNGVELPPTTRDNMRALGIPARRTSRIMDSNGRSSVDSRS